MIFSNESVAGGVRFYAIDSNKFKTSVLTFSITLPMTPRAYAYNKLLSGLLSRGSEKYPSVTELNLKLDRLYGSSVDVRSPMIGNNLIFTLTAETLDNRFIPDGVDTIGGVIDVVSQLLLHPLICDSRFNPSHFEAERKILIDDINSARSNTRAYATTRCVELLRDFSDIPTLEELKAIVQDATLEDIIAHYRNMISTAPLDIFYIGATSSCVVKERVAEAFSEYPCKSSSSTPKQIVPFPTGISRTGSEKMPVAQSKLSMIFNTGACISPDNDKYYTALMLNEIFGGSVSSRLFTVVREKMGLCYYCSSSYGIYTGLILVSSGIELEKIQTVRSAVVEQMNEIKLGNFSDEELLTAKKSLTNSYAQLYDSPFELQAFYSGRVLLGVKDSIECCIDKIWSVDASKIRELASKVELEACFFIEGMGGTDECEEDDNDNE